MDIEPQPCFYILTSFTHNVNRLSAHDNSSNTFKCFIVQRVTYKTNDNYICHVASNTINLQFNNLDTPDVVSHNSLNICSNVAFN